MSDLYTSDVNILALASAFVSQGDTTNPCIADSVEVDGEHITIYYSWARGSATWTVTHLELMAYGWNNPKD